MKKIIVALALGLVGCAGADLVQSPVGSDSPYAPINESQRLGKVSYRIRKDPDLNQESREIAYKTMFDSCNGKYEIVSEHESQKSYHNPGNTTYIGNVGYNDGGTYIKTYNNIEYKCVTKAE